MDLTGANQEQARPHNRRAVLETIRQRGASSRAEIARAVGLTTQTVSTITSELLDRGFVILRPGKPKGRGFPAPSFQIDPNGGFAIGIAVSPRGLEAGLMNLAGDLIARRRIDAARLSARAAFEMIGGIVPTLVDGRADEKILGVGLSLPGPFGVKSMSFVGSTTMEGWSESDVCQGLRSSVRYPAFFDGTISAAAHGERLYGRGKEFRDFFYLYLDAGLGGAMIYRHQVMRGAYGNASEIGHIPIVLDGDPCACGNRGCLERYISMEAYERRTAEVGEDQWLAEVAPLLRAAIVTIENLYEPETIVLGGIAPEALQARLLALAEDLPVSLGARSNRTVPRLVASRAGSDAPIRGAASLAVRYVFAADGESASAGPDLFARRRQWQTS